MSAVIGTGVSLGILQGSETQRDSRSIEDRIKRYVYHTLRSPRERYAQIEAMRGRHPVRMLCELFEVAPSGYYRWKQRGPSARRRHDTVIAKQIIVFHRASRGAYGAPRLVVDLKEAGIRTSKRRCARLMREQGLRGRKKHSRRPRTTDSRHEKPVAANLMAQMPEPTGPNQCWLTDITYLETAEGWPSLNTNIASAPETGWPSSPAT
jgi:putative transposase